MNKDTICCESVYSGDGIGSHSHQCTFKAKVKRDGKLYCNIHDPVKVEEKRDKCNKKVDERYKKIKEAWRRKKAEAHYCENLSTEYLETHQAEAEEG